ncbi:MAG TPA: IclR family transcriptional regulator [Thermomicrobiales bacterium]|jgi:DNA-binding IclR family transcriptional regulator|nr:IclR family transcriptional regulator [Thermomicrobiales bacterium]
MNGTPSPQSSVKSAARSLDLLELFAEARDDLSLNDVCRQTGWPKSSALHLLRTLRDRDYLADGVQERTYRLGPRVARLGGAYLQRVDVVREGLPVIRDVSRRCDETVHLAALQGQMVQYLAKEEGSSHMRMVSAIGSTLPAHTTGVGKMLLSALPADQLERLYPPGEQLTGLTETTITDRDALFATLREIAKRGYARDHGESTMGLECIAAPIRDASGAVVAAISVSVPQPRFTPDREPFLLATILSGAEALSTRLGYAASISTTATVD